MTNKKTLEVGDILYEFAGGSKVCRHVWQVVRVTKTQAVAVSGALRIKFKRILNGTIAMEVSPLGIQTSFYRIATPELVFEFGGDALRFYLGFWMPTVLKSLNLEEMRQLKTLFQSKLPPTE